MSWKWIFCEEGWGDTGECCCNCANQITLSKHPWNQINEGPCSEDSGLYACVVEHDIEDNRNGVVFETKHGYCELYVGKSIREKKLDRIIK